MNCRRNLVWDDERGVSIVGLGVLKKYYTVSELHLSQTDSTQDLLRLSVCRWEIESFRMHVQTLCMGDSTSSKMPLRKDRQGISKLDGALSQF